MTNHGATEAKNPMSWQEGSHVAEAVLGLQVRDERHELRHDGRLLVAQLVQQAVRRETPATQRAMSESEPIVDQPGQQTVRLTGCTLDTSGPAKQHLNCPVSTAGQGKLAHTPHAPYLAATG